MALNANAQKSREIRDWLGLVTVDGSYRDAIDLLEDGVRLDDLGDLIDPWDDGSWDTPPPERHALLIAVCGAIIIICVLALVIK